MFPFSTCYQIPRLNCKFKRLDVSPQPMTLLVKTKLTIVEKKFFNTNTLTNGTKYSRIDEVNFLKAVFHKIYLVHSWIICPNCNCMSLNVGIELLICEGNGHIFRCSVTNTDLFWNCSNSMCAQTSESSKMFLLYIYST